MAIKKIMAGNQVDERGALMNPDSPNLYHNVPQLAPVANGTYPILYIIITVVILLSYRLKETCV